jgi:hypothetical protein
MRSKPEAPSPDRSGSIFSPGPKARAHCRRSLSPAEFGKCNIDAFITRDAVGPGGEPIPSVVARYGVSLFICNRNVTCSTARASSSRSNRSIVGLACPSRVPILACPSRVPMPRSLQARVLPTNDAIEASQLKSHQNHDVAACPSGMPTGHVARPDVVKREAQSHRGARCLCHFETARQLWRGSWHGCA